MVAQDVKEKASGDKVPVIDVTQAGYLEVLGKGPVPASKPVVVKTKLISMTAEKKIIVLLCPVLRFCVSISVASYGCCYC